MLSQDLIGQIKHLELKAGRLVTDVLSGEYSSAFRGHGMEFEKVREYIPGDEVRLIDWNVTARMNAPYIKEYREERELTLILLVDVSRSLEFGTTGRLKREVALELAAVLSFLATKNNDKVGLIFFSDHVEGWIPPKKGKGHIWRMIKELLTYEGRGSKTDIGGALQYLTKVLKRKAMVFVVSDFYDSSYLVPLRVAAAKHDLTLVRVKDQHETDFKTLGLVEFEDAETGESVLVDTSHPSFQELYGRAVNDDERRWDQDLRKLKVSTFDVNTRETVVLALTRYLKMRERRRIHG